MSDLLPSKPPVTPDHGDPRVLSLTGERADEVFTALSSATARQILAVLYEDPLPATELADHTGTSVQNVRYHLDRMRDADLVSVADTWYSEKGNEMRVYAPTDTALVLCGSESDSTDRLRKAIPRLLGLVSIFAIASLLVQTLYNRFVPDPLPTPRTSDVSVFAEPAPPEPSHGFDPTVLAEPGLVFFVGCLTGLLVIGAFVVLFERYGDAVQP